MHRCISIVAMVPLRMFGNVSEDAYIRIRFCMMMRGEIYV